MAIVKLLEPTDMTTLLAAFTGHVSSSGPTFANTQSTVYGEGYFAVLGTFGGAPFDGLIDFAVIDTGDANDFPNILIDWTSTAEKTAIYDVFGEIQTGKVSAVLPLFLYGSDVITGSRGNDKVRGYEGHDSLNGAAGDDELDGNNGNDKLLGSAGRDTLGGNDGRDVLIGGGGKDNLCPFTFAGSPANDGDRDIIRFLALGDSGTTAATRDTITGFVKGPGATADRIDLSPIDANPALPGNQAFQLVTAFTAAKGEVRLLKTGASTVIQVDGDNDPAVDMTILVFGVTGLKGFDLIL